MKYAAPLTLLALLACGDDNDDAASPADLHDVLTIERAIGGIDEERAEYEFGRIGGLALLDDGRIAVADPTNHVVRVYASDGTHSFSIGRQGSGPGELDGPCCPATDPQNRLWIRDGGNARYNIYRLEEDSAAFLAQVRMAHGDVNRYAPVTFDDLGRVIDIGSRADPATGQRATYRLHLDSTGTVVQQERLHEPPPDSTAMKAVTRTVAAGRVTHFAYQPFGPLAVFAHSATGEFAHALTSRYAIDWRDAQGDLIRHLTGEPASQGPPLSPNEHARGNEQIEENVKFLGVGRMQLGFDLPSHKPPLRDLFFDRHGRLWVELSTPDGEDRTAHVYERDGTLERTVQWPRHVDLRDGMIRGDIAWGIQRDSLDVESIVRLRGLTQRVTD